MTCITCCKDCKDRHIGCHSSCEDYISQKEEDIRRKRKVGEAKAAYNFQRNYIKDAVERTMKTNRRK